jgi:lipoate-protein ligase A
MGIPIARRISGGGAVWHDAGNLNFCLITFRGEYRQIDVFGQTIDALRDLGICACLQNTNSLVADGRKISGTAFCFRGAGVLHHGTLLIHSDLDSLRCALHPALPELETRAVPSRPAEVANTSEFAPTITHEDAIRALARHFANANRWTDAPQPEDGHESFFLAARRRASVSPFHDSPAFEWTIAQGGPRIRCERGEVTQITLPDGRKARERPFAFEREALARALAEYSDAWSQAVLARDW